MGGRRLLLAGAALAAAVLVTGAFAGWFDGLLGGAATEDGDAEPGLHAGADDPRFDPGASLAGRTRPSLAGKGRLEGRVLDYDTRAPIEGARIAVSGPTHNGEDIVVRTVTDATGRFSIEGLATGPDYTVGVREDVAADPRVLSLRHVAVRRASVHDLGDLLLGRRGEMAGRVIDERGDGIADAELRLLQPPGNLHEFLSSFALLMAEAQHDAAYLAKVRTDAAGRFALPDVAPGRYVLVTRAAGFARRSMAVVMTQDGPAGGEVIVELDPRASVTGRVIDASGRPVPEAEVAFWSLAEVGDGRMQHAFDPVDAQGRFSIVGADPTAETLWMLVRAPDYPVHIFPVAGDAEDVGDLALHAVGVLRVTFLDEAGRPVPGAHVMLRCMTWSEDDAEEDDGVEGVRMGIHVEVTDERGEVSLRGRQGDLIALVVTHPSLGSMFLGPHDDRESRPVTVSGIEDWRVPGGERAVTLRLSERIRVFGRVVDAEGEPIADAEVVLGASGYGRGHTDGEGVYDLRGFRGDTRVFAAKRGYVPVLEDARWNAEEAPKGATEVEREVVLSHAATITGRVVDEMGKPIAGAAVQLAGMVVDEMEWHPLATPPRATTGGDGVYVLTGCVGGEGQEVTARHPRYYRADVSVPYVATGKRTLAADIVMRAPVRRIIRVVDETGDAVSGVRLEVKPLDADGDVRDAAIVDFFEDATSDAITDAQGLARTQPVPRGGLRVTGTREGLATSRADFAADAEERVLVLRAAHELEIRVTGPEGQLVQTLVWLGPASMRQRGAEWVEPEVETSTRGRARFRGVPDVPLKVTLDHEDFMYLEQDVRVGTGPVELKLAGFDAGTRDRIAEIDDELSRLQKTLEAEHEGPAYVAAIKRRGKLGEERDRLRGKTYEGR